MSEPAAPSRPVSRHAIALGCALLATLALILLAYHLKRELVLNVGDLGDQAFVSGFYADEADLAYRYRWSTAEASASFDGAGSAMPVEVTLRAQGARPDVTASTAVTVSLRLNGSSLQPAQVTSTQQLGDYTLQVAGGSLSPPYVIALSSSTFNPPGDARTLGIKVDRVQVVQSGAGLNLPPLGSLLWPLVAVAGLFGLFAWLAWPVPLIVSLVGALVAGTLAYANPLYMAAYFPPVAAVLGVAGLAVWQRRRLARWPSAVDGLARTRLAEAIMLGAMLVYAVVSLWTVAQVDWIGHADYAENAIVARNFVDGKGLTVDYVAQFYKDYPGISHPAETWPLLQPVVIVPFFYLFGAQTWAAKLPNLLIVLALAWLVFCVASRLWDKRAGLLAGLLTLLHPYFFNSVLYPINDLVFTAIFFALAWVVWERVTSESAAWKRAWVDVLVGALAGLLVWSKPSGATLLVGLALWAAWLWWRRRRAAGMGAGALRPWLPVLGGLVVVLLPLVVRNMLAFGQPYFSTESYDAPILRYWPFHDWEDIYKYYVGSELPHWRWVIGGKFGYQNLFDAIGTNIRWVWEQGVASDPTSGNYVLGILPLAGALLGMAALSRKAAGLFGLVAVSLAGYTLFVLGYWHFEGRYFQVAVPWLYMLLAWGIIWAWDRVRDLSGSRPGLRWGLLLLPVAVLAFLWPSISQIRTQVESDTRPTGFAKTMGWLRDNSTPQDVVMTRDPWELNWYTERRAVMIPNDDLATIKHVASQYGVTMLQLGGPVDRADMSACPRDPSSKGPFPTGSRPALGSLYCGKEMPGFRLVYQQGGGTIYRLEK